MVEIFTLLYPYGGLSLFLMSLYIGVREKNSKRSYDLIGVGLPVILFSLAFLIDVFFGITSEIHSLGVYAERLLYVLGMIIILIEGVYIYWIGKGNF
ncbi:MAG: hypothetical protein R6W73_00565 [Candidatus Saliniplasma sp.]